MENLIEEGQKVIAATYSAYEVITEIFQRIQKELAEAGLFVPTERELVIMEQRYEVKHGMNITLDVNEYDLIKAVHDKINAGEYMDMGVFHELQTRLCPNWGNRIDEFEATTSKEEIRKIAEE